MDIFKDYKPGERVRIVGYSEASCNAYGNVDEVTKTELTLSTTPYGGNLKERPFNFVEVELPVVTLKHLAAIEAKQSAPVDNTVDDDRFIATYQERLLRVVHASDPDSVDRGEEADTPFFSIICPGDTYHDQVVFTLNLDGKSWERCQVLDAALLKLEKHYGLI